MSAATAERSLRRQRAFQEQIPRLGCRGIGHLLLLRGGHSRAEDAAPAVRLVDLRPPLSWVSVPSVCRSRKRFTAIRRWPLRAFAGDNASRQIFLQTAEFAAIFV